MSPSRWAVEHRRGTAAAFHQRSVPDPPVHAVWWFEVSQPAIVLGSTQRLEVVDAEAAASAGTEVARRRSGGGAVHLVPGFATWIDVVLPADDPRWCDDVSRSFHWVGRAWAATLADCGHPGAVVHEGPLVRTTWSDLVCFAGLGPGEVTIGGRKVVGISQRRTRDAARFQCAVLHRWDPGALLALLALGPGARDQAAGELSEVAAGIGAHPATTLVDRLLAHLDA